MKIRIENKIVWRVDLVCQGARTKKLIMLGGRMKQQQVWHQTNDQNPRPNRPSPPCNGLGVEGGVMLVSLVL